MIEPNAATILLVDAVPTNRIIVNVLLSAAGYRVGQCETLAEVPAAVLRNPPDLILTALDLPDGPGERLPNILQRIVPDTVIPVVGISNENDHNARLRALGAGLDDVLQHPVDDRILLARVGNLIRLHQLGPRTGDVAVPVQKPNELREAPTPFVGMEPIANLAVLGSDSFQKMDCLTQLGHHADIQLAPLQWSNDCVLTGNADCVIYQADSFRSIARLAKLIKDPCPAKPSFIAVSPPALFADALDVDADDAIVGLPHERELVIRVRGLLRRRARLAHVMRQYYGPRSAYA